MSFRGMSEHLHPSYRDWLLFSFHADEDQSWTEERAFSAPLAQQQPERYVKGHLQFHADPKQGLQRRVRTRIEQSEIECPIVVAEQR